MRKDAASERKKLKTAKKERKGKNKERQTDTEDIYGKKEKSVRNGFLKCPQKGKKNKKYISKMDKNEK